MRVLAVVLLVSACAPKMIPGTKVEDTKENRDVLEVLMAYKAALEERNVDAIITLCSPKFYEDNGNADPADDYAYSDLARILPDTFKRLKEVRVELEVKEVKVDDKKARADMRFLYQAKMALPAGEKWHADTELNRIELERGKDGAWKIVKGL